MPLTNFLKHKFEQVKIYIFKYPLLLPITMYFLSLLVLSPWGNFAISDDYYYLNQVKAFSLGIFTKSALIGPIFILQGLIGLVWSWFFGLSYLSLHVLTIVISLLCLVGLNGILGLLDIKRDLRVVTLIILTFLPQFYFYSVSFMTENYFLVFVVWSVYFFLKYLGTDRTKHLFLACVLGGLSIMIRQYGVVLFGTYLFVYVLYSYKNLKLKPAIALIGPFFILGLLAFLWPKYTSNVDLKSQNLLLFFGGLPAFFGRLFSLSIIPYLGFLLLPFSPFLFSKLPVKLRILVGFLVMLLVYPLYSANLFSLRNLFYLEGLNARLSVNIRENLFNNVAFKLFMTFITSFSFSTVLVTTLKSLRLSKMLTIDKTQFTLITLNIGFYLIVLVTDRVFDRYFLNFFVILVVFVAYCLRNLEFNISWVSVFSLLGVIFVVFLLTFDYFSVNQLKWSLAEKLSSTNAVPRNQIFVDNVYKSTVYIEESANYKGLFSVDPKDYRPSCFVQEYVKQEPNSLWNLINKFSNRSVIARYFPNPKIPNSELSKGGANHFDSSDKLFYDVEYADPLYNLVGKRTFVRAFCADYKK